MTTATTIATNLERVRERIARACQRAGRAPEGVTLVGATKTQLPAALAEAWAAGLRDFGENRVQEAVAKQPAVAELLGPAARPEWHMIGHLQTNKAKVAARAFAILHGVDSARTIDALSHHAHGLALPVMLEVNIAGDPAKHGVSPESLPALVEHARALPHLRIVGLMTIPPQTDDPEDTRPHFTALRRLAEDHRLPNLSMGMTEDFEVAIEEGATHVRVGRAIFGERPV